MSKGHSYKGFESLYNSTRMNLKMYFHTFLVFFALHICIFAFMSHNHFRSQSWTYPFLKNYIKAKITASVKPSHVIRISHNGKPYLVRAGDYVTQYRPYYEGILERLLHYLLLTSSIYFLYPGVLFLFKKQAKAQYDTEFVRGSKLIPSKALKRQIKKSRHDTYINIGDIPLPVKDEVRHTFIVGKPGAGKTVLLNQVLSSLKARGDRGIVYDYKGDYVSKFYDPENDLLFNPLDKRSLGWSVMNEINSAMDIESIAHSLIPQAYQSDPFWNDAARDVFTGILHFLYDKGMRKNSDLWSALTAPGEKIVEMLKSVNGGHRGLRYVEDASSKQAMSVFSVMMQYTRAFEYMHDGDGDFSIDRWLKSGKGWIYVTNYPIIQDTLRPILSLFIDLLGRKLLSEPEDYEKRIFFFLDEFGTLQRLSTIVRLLTLSRSKGGSVWIGIQDTGQIDKLYTSPLRQAIVNACGNNVILSVSDPDTARFLSDKIGDTAYRKTEETHSMGVKSHKDGLSVSYRDKEERLVLPSEIMNLCDLECYIKLPDYDVSKISLTYHPYKDNHEPLLIRDSLYLNSSCQSENKESNNSDSLENVRACDATNNEIVKEETAESHEEDISECHVESGKKMKGRIVLKRSNGDRKYT